MNPNLIIINKAINSSNKIMVGIIIPKTMVGMIITSIKIITNSKRMIFGEHKDKREIQTIFMKILIFLKVFSISTKKIPINTNIKINIRTNIKTNIKINTKNQGELK